MRGEALKGHLDLLLLSILAEGARHGYAVIEDLRRRSEGTFELPEGTVYPALHRLEAEGLLKSGWVTHRGRRRRVYQVTRRGRKELVRQRGEWSEFSGAVVAVIGGAA